MLLISSVTGTEIRVDDRQVIRLVKRPCADLPAFRPLISAFPLKIENGAFGTNRIGLEDIPSLIRLLRLKARSFQNSDFYLEGPDSFSPR